MTGKRASEIKKVLYGLFRKNLGLKIFSLVFAFIVWLYVIGGSTQDVSYSLRLKIHGVPAGYTISNPLPKSIRVKFRGSRVSLMRLNKNLAFKIDASLLPGKRNTLILSESYLNIPHGVRVIRIYPRVIPITIEKVTRKLERVLPQTAGSLADGFILRKITVKPAFVEVEGPESIVKHLSGIKTGIIDLSKYKRGETLAVSLKKPAKIIKILYNKKIIATVYAVKK